MHNCRTCFLPVLYQPIVSLLGSNPCSEAAVGLIDCLPESRQREVPLFTEIIAEQWSGVVYTHTHTSTHTPTHTQLPQLCMWQLSLLSAACGISPHLPYSLLLYHFPFSPFPNLHLTFLPPLSLITFSLLSSYLCLSCL